MAKEKAKRQGIELDRAERLLGKALFRGVPANVAWNWRKRQLVPAEHVLDRFIELMSVGPARASQEPAIRSTRSLPTEADVEQLGPLWTRLVDIVKNREGVDRYQWGIIKSVLQGGQGGERDAVGELPKIASGKRRK